MKRQDIFGLRDIGLNLSTETDATLTLDKETAVDMAAGPLGVHTKRDVVDPTVGRAQVAASKKVTRYFPGQVPKWVKPEPEAEAAQFRAVARQRVKQAPVVLSRSSAPSEPAAVNLKKEEHEVKPEAEDDAAARRARVRAKLKARAAAETEIIEEVIVQPRASPSLSPAVIQIQKDGSASESISSSSSDDEADNDDYEDASKSSFDEESDDEEEIRPVFVPRCARDTVREAKEIEARNIEAQVKQAARKEARKEESRAMVAEVVLRSEHEEEAAQKTEADSEIDAPDDSADSDDEATYDAWRIRELKRLSRDAQARSAATDEAADTERRRNLTAEERAAEDKALGKGKKPQKAKWKFLQKYHHKGAFFMDEASLAKDDVRARDIHGATGIDKFDREKLPKVMQVRGFGFSGRSKYTHLADQDTTFIDRDYEYGWHKRNTNDSIRQRYESKRAGQGDIDTVSTQKKFRRR